MLVWCTHHYSSKWNSFTALKVPCIPLIYPHFPGDLWQLFTVSIVLPVPECHTVEIVQDVACSDWLLSLSNVHLRFLPAFLWLDSSCLFIAEKYSIVWMYLFISSPNEWYFCCFQFLAMKNKAGFGIDNFNSGVKYPGVQLSDRMARLFSFVRNVQLSSKQLYQFAFWPVRNESPCCSTIRVSTCCCQCSGFGPFQ